jgi:hypothetical protein
MEHYQQHYQHREVQCYIDIYPANAYQLSDSDSKDPDYFGDEDTTFDVGRPENGEDMAFIAKSRGEWGNYVQIAIVGRDAYNGVVAGTAAATLGSICYII